MSLGIVANYVISGSISSFKWLRFTCWIGIFISAREPGVCMWSCGDIPGNCYDRDDLMCHLVWKKVGMGVVDKTQEDSFCHRDLECHSTSMVDSGCGFYRSNLMYRLKRWGCKPWSGNPWMFHHVPRYIMWHSRLIKCWNFRLHITVPTSLCRLCYCFTERYQW